MPRKKSHGGRSAEQLIAAHNRKLRKKLKDSFLKSYEWRKLRMQAIKKYGAKCQCCGATPEDGIVLNVDHIKPRRKYPHLALDINNLQVLCHVCNHGKGNWDETDWRTETDPLMEAKMVIRSILETE